MFLYYHARRHDVATDTVAQYSHIGNNCVINTFTEVRINLRCVRLRSETLDTANLMMSV